MNDLSSFDAARPGDFGIIGDPVAHSLSPAMQNAALKDWWTKSGKPAADAPRYHLFPVTPADVPTSLTTIRQKKIAGLNVTVPHKTAVVPVLDELDPFAKTVGAVNTIRNDGGKLAGFNTDGPGFERTIRDMDISPETALVLGAGGTGQVIVQQLRKMKVRRVFWWNRTISRIESQIEAMGDPDDVRLTADHQLAKACAASDLIVNATSVGLEDGDGLPAGGLVFSAEQAAFDVVYHRRTAFLDAADAAGAFICGGLPMLLHQGAAAFEIWTGAKAPVDLMREALDAALKEKGIKPIWPSAI